MALDADVLASECGADSAESAAKIRLLTLDSLDGRTASAKLVRTLIEAIENDLGGNEHLSEGVKQLVQRAAILGAYIEHFEASWIKGEQFDSSEYLSAINAQRRVLATVGLERRARDVTDGTAVSIARQLAAVAQDSSAGGAWPSERMSDLEIARRLAFILEKGAREADAAKAKNEAGPAPVVAG
jgi:hypothetical protein